MRRIIKNNIFGFILGIILCSGIVYGVNIYESNTIKYSPTDTSWNVSNVNEAINSLYNMKTELNNTKTELDSTKTELNSTKTALNNLKGIGDATAAQILSGKKAVVKGSTLTGTMTDRGAWTNTPTGSGKVTIPAGYHNGSGYVNTATAYTNGYNAGVAANTSRISTGTWTGTTSGNINIGYKPDWIFAATQPSCEKQAIYIYNKNIAENRILYSVN